jgi:small subunit ribosomal protein S6
LLREYELTVITRADLQEADTAKLLGVYEELMTKDGGEILKKDSWGVKKLTYPIKKQFRGVYTNYDFVGDPAHLAEAERKMRIDESVLRYMSVHLDDEVDVAQRKADLAKKKQMREAMAARENEMGDDDGPPMASSGERER